MAGHNDIGDTYLVSHTCNKDKVETLSYLQEGLAAALLSLQAIEMKDNTINEKISSIEAQLKKVQQQLNQATKKVKQSELLREANKPKLILPNFGTTDTFKVEDAKLYCIPFSDSPDSASLSEFWSKIVTFVELHSLNEDCVNKLMGCLLVKEPYSTFFHHRKKPLVEILEVLVDRYDQVNTITDYMSQLDNIYRKSDETISSIMARTSALISKTAAIVNESERESRKIFLMQNYLKKFASDKATKQLTYQTNLALRNGFILSYNDQLDICKMAEQEHN